MKKEKLTNNDIPEDMELTMDFVHKSYKYKPKELFIKELKWKYLIRNVMKGKNVLMTGMSGGGKTLSATTIAKVLKRPFFKIPTGQTQDPRATLIGNTFFNKEKGTYFDQSKFVKAIQTENAIILLDELSRAHPEAWNILMTVLDEDQRYLQLDEAESQPIIEVAKGVSFIATANIGTEYTSTRIFDRALRDRFQTIEMDLLTKEEEIELLSMLYPEVEKKTIKAIANIASETRDDVKSESPKLDTAISTRMTVQMGEIVSDGFTLLEAMEICVLPFYDTSGGTDSERQYFMQLMDKWLEKEEDEKELYVEKDSENEEGDSKIKKDNPFLV